MSLRTIVERRQGAAEQPLLMGFDLGTGGLDVTLADAYTLEPVPGGRAEEPYPTLGDGTGLSVQDPRRWAQALEDALLDLDHRELFEDRIVVGVGISGQMHAGVWLDGEDGPCSLASLWNCNSAVEDGRVLSGLAEQKIDPRLTISHVRKELIQRRHWWTENVRRITTPAGYLGYLLTASHGLGIGEASGSGFLDPESGTLSKERCGFLEKFDPCIKDKLVPVIAPGALYARLRRLSDAADKAGAAVAAPEGDQPALCIGSGVIRPGQAALNVGTSIVIDYLSDSRVSDESGTIDFFFDALGQKLNMGLAANGLQVCDRVVKPFAEQAGISDPGKARAELDRLAANTPFDCSGSLFIDFGTAETFLGVNQPFQKEVDWPENAGWGLRWQNARNLTGTLLRMRLKSLSAGGAKPTELVAGGDAVKDAGLMQTWANALQVPISVPRLEIPACSLGALRLAAAAEELRFGSEDADFRELLAELCESEAVETIYRPDPERDAAFARFEAMILDAVQ